MPIEPQPLSDDPISNSLHHASDVHGDDWGEWQTWEEETELNPVEEEK